MIKIQIYLAIEFEKVLANCLTKCWQVVTKSVRELSGCLDLLERLELLERPLKYWKDQRNSRELKYIQDLYP